MFLILLHIFVYKYRSLGEEDNDDCNYDDGCEDDDSLNDDFGGATDHKLFSK